MKFHDFNKILKFPSFCMNDFNGIQYILLEYADFINFQVDF